MKGIDISAWQSDFTDFSKLRSGGYEFVICKISEGQETDKSFSQHYENLKEQGLSIGAYVFSHATSTTKAKAEAEYAVKVLSGKTLDLPIFIDLEADDINFGWNTSIMPVALAFGEVIKAAGYKWGVYANQSWLIHKLDVDALLGAGAMIWCAKYSEEQPTVYCDIWQYADNGTVPGYSKKVDMNVMLNTNAPDEPEKQPEETEKEESSLTESEAIAKLIACVMNQVGYLEKKTNAQLDDKTANAGSNNWNRYARDIDNKYPDFYNGKKNGYSWCDIFVDWCFIECFGYENALKLLYQPTKSAGAGCKYSANYYRDNGAFKITPRVGDQVFFGDYGNEGHTGIVVAVDGNAITIVEGNTSGGYGVDANGDGVYMKRYDIGTQYIPGYGRPNWATVCGEDQTEKDVVNTGYPMIKRGSTGEYVKKAQRLLIGKGYLCGSSGADGDFGYDTYCAVVKFQRDNKLDTDGIIGANTWAALLKDETLTVPEPEKETEQAGTMCSVDLPVLREGDSGFPVLTVQLLLVKQGVYVKYTDGEFGPDTLAKVKNFQSGNGLTADGVVGATTWGKLIKG